MLIRETSRAALGRRCRPGADEPPDVSLLRRRGRRSGAAVVDTLVGDGTRALCDQASRCSSVHWRLASLFHAKVDRTLSRFSASCRQCSNRNWLMIVASPPTSSDGSSALAAMVCSPRLVRSSCADQSFMGPDAWPLGAARHRPHPRWRAERGGVALDLQTGCRCSAEQRQPEVRGTRWISRPDFSHDGSSAETWTNWSPARPRHPRE